MKIWYLAALWLVAAVGIFAFSVPAEAYPSPLSCTRDRYVNASTGNDSNNGQSPGSAWLTIQHADVAGLVAGDCVHVADGTYTINGDTNFSAGGNSNTAGGYVRWMGNSNINTIITGTCSFGLIRLNAPFVAWENFRINASGCHSGSGTSASGYCILNNGGTPHHVMILNNDISNCAGEIGLGDAEFYLVAGNKIHDTTDAWLSAI